MQGFSVNLQGFSVYLQGLSVNLQALGLICTQIKARVHLETVAFRVQGFAVLGGWTLPALRAHRMGRSSPRNCILLHTEWAGTVHETASCCTQNGQAQSTKQHLAAHRMGRSSPRNSILLHTEWAVQCTKQHLVAHRMGRGSPQNSILLHTGMFVDAVRKL